jgi:hypothetical protein
VDRPRWLACPAATTPWHDRSGLLCGVMGEFGQNTRVRVRGDGDRRMAQHRLYGLHVHSGCESEGRGAVAQVVKPDRRQVGLPGEFAEVVGDVGRVQLGAGRGGEDQAGVVPVGAGGEAFAVLAATVRG